MYTNRALSGRTCKNEPKIFITIFFFNQVFWQEQQQQGFSFCCLKGQKLSLGSEGKRLTKSKWSPPVCSIRYAGSPLGNKEKIIIDWYQPARAICLGTGKSIQSNHGKIKWFQMKPKEILISAQHNITFWLQNWGIKALRFSAEFGYRHYCGLNRNFMNFMEPCNQISPAKLNSLISVNILNICSHGFD